MVTSPTSLNCMTRAVTERTKRLSYFGIAVAAFYVVAAVCAIAVADVAAADSAGAAAVSATFAVAANVTSGGVCVRIASLSVCLSAV